MNWREIPGLVGYRVADTGEVFSPYTGKALTPEVTQFGYHRIGVKGKKYRIHHLVCEAFHGPRPSPEHIVNHKNGTKSDNRAENLEWVTRAGNIAHASQNGLLAVRATGVGPGKLSMAKARLIRGMAASGRSNNAISRELGVSATMVGLVVNNRCWREQTSPNLPLCDTSSH